MWLELRESGEEEGDEMGRWGESCRAVGTHSKLESRGGKQSDSGASSVTGIAFWSTDYVVNPSCLNCP